MKTIDRAEAARIARALVKYSSSQQALRGMKSLGRRDCLARQLVDSVRRVRYVATILGRPIDKRRGDPSDDQLFDPVRAAALANLTGARDEACWLVFLLVHFGKHRRGGWRYVREVYGRLGAGIWDWKAVAANPGEFRSWLSKHERHLARTGSGFGPHRRYESLSGSSPGGTGAIVASYVDWVGSSKSHERLFTGFSAGRGPDLAFAAAFDSMQLVLRFGRLAKFDYLCMLSKLGVFAISPGSPFLKGASGPLRGARKLFGGGATDILDAKAARLAKYLGVGMQEMEDALCNWQKSPDQFVAFRG